MGIGPRGDEAAGDLASWGVGGAEGIVKARGGELALGLEDAKEEASTFCVMASEDATKALFYALFFLRMEACIVAFEPACE